jgi:hypothetical protein
MGPPGSSGITGSRNSQSRSVVQPALNPRGDLIGVTLRECPRDAQCTHDVSDGDGALVKYVGANIVKQKVKAFSLSVRVGSSQARHVPDHLGEAKALLIPPET